MSEQPNLPIIKPTASITFEVSCKRCDKKTLSVKGFPISDLKESVLRELMKTSGWTFLKGEGFHTECLEAMLLGDDVSPGKGYVSGPVEVQAPPVTVPERVDVPVTSLPALPAPPSALPKVPKPVKFGSGPEDRGPHQPQDSPLHSCRRCGTFHGQCPECGIGADEGHRENCRWGLHGTG